MTQTTDKKVEVEELQQQEDVKAALRQAATSQEVAKPTAEVKDKAWFVTYGLLLLGLVCFYYLLGIRLLEFAAAYVPTLQRFTVGGIFIVLTLAVAKGIDVYLLGQVDNVASRYNLKRVLKLVVMLAIVGIALSVLSTTWYTPLISLGIGSLILGFALQTPITSFIGWIYILARQPYRVGDRIEIGGARGDVIDVSYLDTTLWEFGGPYLSTEHPSGRIIKFPNSFVLEAAVYNYSWPLFPYIWNEIKLELAYESDLEWVARVMREVVEEEVGEAMVEHVQLYRELLSKTPVNELEIRERPAVHFRASENTWLEAIVRYLVPPKEAGRIKTRLTQNLLTRLNREADRVLFPKSNLR
jgi:small-conductance mechanosensitive channel